MIHRSRKITFRLTPEEEARYAALAVKGWHNNWSRIIRTALREFWDRKQKAESDNGARQNELALSDKRSPVRQRSTSDKSTGKKVAKAKKK